MTAPSDNKWSDFEFSKVFWRTNQGGWSADDWFIKAEPSRFKPDAQLVVSRRHGYTDEVSSVRLPFMDTELLRGLATWINTVADELDRHDQSNET